MAKFTGNEGRLISSSEAKKFTDPHHALEKNIKARGENFIQAEFFGINTFNQLIEPFKKTCVGFRVYYGARSEDHEGDEPVIGEGKHTSRLIIVPVGADGKDLSSGIGLKDMPAQNDAMIDGPLCPRQCGG